MIGGGATCDSDSTPPPPPTPQEQLTADCFKKQETQVHEVSDFTFTGINIKLMNLTWQFINIKLMT